MRSVTIGDATYSYREYRYRSVHVYLSDSYVMTLTRSDFTGEFRAFPKPANKLGWSTSSYQTERRTPAAAIRAAVTHYDRVPTSWA